MQLRLLFIAALCVFAVLLLNGIAFAQDKKDSQAADIRDINSVYRLDTGDRVRVIVYGETDLSGEFELDSSGELALPLIGTIQATNLSLRELEKLVTEKFKDGYLVSPRVNVEVLNFRPFFILGEVKRPGSYPYVSGLTVINAVALAGGYTYRAKTSNFTLLRGKGSDRKEMQVDEEDVILPGDTVRVEERFF